MNWNNGAPWAAVCLAALLTAGATGCATCGCRSRAALSPERTEQLRQQRKTLTEERTFKRQALAREADREAGVNEKSTYYEYLKAEVARLDLEICNLTCQIRPY